MARYNFCVILTVCTLLTNGTAYALLRIRVILAVAFAVSGVVSNNLALGACVCIRFCVVYILAFSEVANTATVYLFAEGAFNSRET